MRARATARSIFEQAGADVGVDADVLASLFSHCMTAVHREALRNGSCTVRGLGRFDEAQGQCVVFTPKKAAPAQPTHAPFADNQLRQRWEKGSA